jgi:hypothetical protein
MLLNIGLTSCKVSPKGESYIKKEITLFCFIISLEMDYNLSRYFFCSEVIIEL